MNMPADPGTFLKTAEAIEDWKRAFTAAFVALRVKDEHQQILPYGKRVNIDAQRACEIADACISHQDLNVKPRDYRPGPSGEPPTLAELVERLRPEFERRNITPPPPFVSQSDDSDQARKPTKETPAK